MIKLSLYDFDKTIYNGDTGLDILLYTLKTVPKTRIFIPEILLSVVLVSLKIISQIKCKEKIYHFLSILTKDEWTKIIAEFWDLYSIKFFPLVIEQILEDKKNGYTIGIISASAEIMLHPIMGYIPADFLIGTIFGRVGKKMSSVIIGKNCKKEEKVARLSYYMRTTYPDQLYIVEKMYSDSLHDIALFDIANQKFTVKSDGSITPGLPKHNYNL